MNGVVRPTPAETAAERLGIVLPEECREGVEANLRLLDQHWRTLRGEDSRP